MKRRSAPLIMAREGRFTRDSTYCLAHVSYRNSVCLSVTTRYRFKPRWDRNSRFSPYDSLESLVTCEQISCCRVRRFPSNEGIKEGYPLKLFYFTTISSSSMRTVAGRHRLAAYHNKHCWRAFRGYQHRLRRTILNRQNRVFSAFFAISGCDAYLKSEFSPMLLGIDQENLRTKLNWCCRASREH